MYNYIRKQLSRYASSLNTNTSQKKEKNYIIQSFSLFGGLTVVMKCGFKSLLRVEIVDYPILIFQYYKTSKNVKFY